MRYHSKTGSRRWGKAIALVLNHYAISPPADATSMGLYCQSSKRNEGPVGDFTVSETQEHATLVSISNSVIICPTLSKTVWFILAVKV